MTAPFSGPPLHPRVRSALVLGVISTVGCVVLLPLLLGPLAWYRGARVGREIDREPHRWSGRQQATAATVLGVVASTLLALLVLGCVVLAVLAAVSLGLDTGYGT